LADFSEKFNHGFGSLQRLRMLIDHEGHEEHEGLKDLKKNPL